MKSSAALTRSIGVAAALVMACVNLGRAADFQVAKKAEGPGDGSVAKPFSTISAAAQIAQPGDTITVHEGVYRERVDPPRGGESESRRIVYQAAPGEKVEIKGSEVIKDWERLQGDVWKASLPNSFFGRFNPYSDLVHGDWFSDRGRPHHTGAVYLDGVWLSEAAKLDDVLNPSAPAGAYLPNIESVKLIRSDRPESITSNRFTSEHGTRLAPCSEGGQCLGYLKDGSWARFDNVDFGQETEEIEIRAASLNTKGTVELHLDSSDGPLLGECALSATGGWQIWQTFTASIKSVAGIRTLCLVFKGKVAGGDPLWFAQVDPKTTTIWAQFADADPNAHLTEINVRQSVFYPSATGRNYITVRGFVLRDAATPWAPPTAEQIGVIGTNWSKGWIIENNIISHSICSGVTLGKYGDKFDNTSADSAEGYVETINRALANGWSGENVGHHIVRDNSISYCEQTGICGSLGGIFSEISGNDIHDIHMRRLFGGQEMAAIKLHGSVDVLIKGNRIHHSNRAMWMDWLAQGLRISANLCYENDQDLFVEVNHGPYLVDNNIFLSRQNVRDVSEGGAFVFNLFGGVIAWLPDKHRETPYLQPHSTVIAGMAKITDTDNRFYDNIFLGTNVVPNAAYGLAGYDQAQHPLQTGANSYFGSARPYAREKDAFVNPALTTKLAVTSDSMESVRLSIPFDAGELAQQPVTTALLGKTDASRAAYENPDASPLKITADYFDASRDENKPQAGPFAFNELGAEMQVWPRVKPKTAAQLKEKP